MTTAPFQSGTVLLFLHHKRDWQELMEDFGRQGMIPCSCRHTFITGAIRTAIWELERAGYITRRQGRFLFFH